MLKIPPPEKWKKRQKMEVSQIGGNRGEKWQYSGGSQDINGVSSGALYLYRAAEQAEGYINVV